MRSQSSPNLPFPVWTYSRWYAAARSDVYPLVSICVLFPLPMQRRRRLAVPAANPFTSEHERSVPDCIGTLDRIGCNAGCVPPVQSGVLRTMHPRTFL